jgi:hypothetical protein
VSRPGISGGRESVRSVSSYVRVSFAVEIVVDASVRQGCLA